MDMRTVELFTAAVINAAPTPRRRHSSADAISLCGCYFLVLPWRRVLVPATGEKLVCELASME